jgi:hypothetical protein
MRGYVIGWTKGGREIKAQSSKKPHTSDVYGDIFVVFSVVQLLMRPSSTHGPCTDACIGLQKAFHKETETLYRAKKATARPPIRVTNEPAPRDLASLVVTVEAVPEAAEPDLVAVWVAVTTVLEPLGLVVVTVPLPAAVV